MFTYFGNQLIKKYNNYRTRALTLDKLMHGSVVLTTKDSVIQQQFTELVHINNILNVYANIHNLA